MDNKNYISRKIYSKNTVNEINRKIKLLGVNNGLDTYTFLNLRLFGTIIIFFALLFVSRFGYIIAPILAFLYYRGITYYLLDYKIKIRRVILESDAINFFEILTLSLETGRNLDEAISVTVESTTGTIRDEFAELLREVRYGKSLTEALESLQDKMPTDTIKNMILSLTQANLYGSSIINSLYNQIDYLREKRKMEIKSEISKVPIKISIISVFFFIPLLLIIILAPVILEYIG